MEQNQERSYAMGCHLAALVGYLIPFGNVLGPLVMWLIKKDESAVIDANGKEALNFQISIALYAFISILLAFVVIGVFLLIAIGIFNLVMIIMAAVKVNKGQEFQYPLSIRFIK